MLDLEGIKNQIRYFECLDSAVSAYKMMTNDEADSFYDAIKRQNKVPLINSIPGSNVLLANHVLKTGISRFALMMYVREEENFIKFDKIQNEDAYINVKNKILKNDPSLTHAECNKVLKQICNAIAHGDVLSSLDFEEYERMLNEIYSHSHSLNAKHPDMERKYYDGHIASSRLKFNYETFFDILPDGTRVRRPRPIKKQLEIAHDDITKIVYLIADNSITMPAAFYINREGNVDVLDLSKPDYESSKSTYVLDEVQKECLQDLQNKYFNENIKNFEKEFNENISLSMAISKIMLGEKFKYLKIRELCDVGATISKGLQETKRSARQIYEAIWDLYQEKLKNGYVYKMKNSGSEIVSKELNLTMRTVLNADLDNIYKNFLMMQVASMLQIVEQNNLKLKVGSSPVVREIAAEYYEKDEFSDREIIKILDNIRDALIHGTYINDVEDRINIYDQVSRTDKTLEYKFTIFNSDLEKIKYACMDAFKDKKAELQQQLPATNLSSTTMSERTL